MLSVYTELPVTLKVAAVEGGCVVPDGNILEPVLSARE